jgi:hypothetical protein
MDRYWAFQVFVNDHAEGKCFFDTYLAKQPVLLPAGDNGDGRVLRGGGGGGVGPRCRACGAEALRVPLRVPVAGAGDWDAVRIPWAQWRLENGEVTREVVGVDLVGRWSRPDGARRQYFRGCTYLERRSIAGEEELSSLISACVSSGRMVRRGSVRATCAARPGRPGSMSCSAWARGGYKSMPPKEDMMSRKGFT